MEEYIATVTKYGRGQRQVSLTDEEIVRCRDCKHMFDWAYDVPMCKLWAFNDPDDSNASSGNALYPTVDLDGYCWRGERR